MKGALKILAGLLVALMGAFWMYGQDLLDQMALTITPAAFLLPVGAAALCAASWWVRNIRRRRSGATPSQGSTQVRDSAVVLAGIFAVGFLFALAVDHFGHTPHQTLATAAIAAVWDSGGIVCVVFCGACLLGGGKN